MFRANDGHVKEDLEELPASPSVPVTSSLAPRGLCEIRHAPLNWCTALWPSRPEVPRTGTVAGHSIGNRRRKGINHATQSSRQSDLASHNGASAVGVRGATAAGAIEYPDSVAGATCKAITEDPSLLAGCGPAAEAIAGSCRYGQALGEANGHYEETNSAGWDIAQDMMNAVGVLTGNPDSAQVNPAFPGWWQGNLPSGAMP